MKISNKLIDTTILLYENGSTLKEVANITKHSTYLIRKILVSNDISIRKKGHGTHFTKKHEPWNKELKGIHLSPDTEFVKGQQPWNKGIVFNPNRNLIKQIRDCALGQEWRYKIYKRDNNTCKLCNFHDKGHKGYIRAHHIYRLKDIVKDYNIRTIEDAYKCKILWNINNGICLCEDCHKKVHRR